MFGFVKQVFVVAITVFSYNVLIVNSIECFSNKFVISSFFIFKEIFQLFFITTNGTLYSCGYKKFDIFIFLMTLLILIILTRVCCI